MFSVFCAYGERRPVRYKIQEIGFPPVKPTQTDDCTSVDSDECVIRRCVENLFYLTDVQTDGYVRAVYQVDVTVVPVRLDPNDMSETDSPVNGLA